ncbi:MAG TPA: FecR family protein [Candidatus Binatia bacterium]|nr:FecR family protein [Candidatus Binatia bacterium]
MTRQMVSALSAIAALVLAAATAAVADSHVRIVRLSLVEGQVQMERVAGQGLEKAILNTPVLEGTRLVTGSDGLAEVEFENQSAVRLAENSEVKFSQLLMNDAGTKINQMRVVKGLVYVDTARGDDIYRMKAGSSSLLMHGNSLVRLSVTPEKMEAAVVRGEVELENQPQAVRIRKNETLTLSFNNSSQYAITKGIEAARFDNWNREREDYERSYTENVNYSGPSRGFGLQDLNYYGDFFYAPGYGYAWQPFGFAGSMAAWDPYSNGAWMLYPGLGYMWASAYPWGWLPYHYGSWVFINGTGWAWLPGGYRGLWWVNSFQRVPRITRAPAGWLAATPPLLSGSRRTVLVGKAGTGPLSIPGGRIPPDFGSLVAGRAMTSSTGLHVRPSAGPRQSVFAPPQAGAGTARANQPAHVFEPPMRTVPGGMRAGEVHGWSGPVGGTAIGGTHGTAPGSSAAHGSSGGSTSHK